MRRVLVSSIGLLLWLTTSTGFADGLIYQLPADGTSVRYKMDLKMARGERTRMADGSLTVSSVGQKTVDDEKCRWIEIKMAMKMDGEERTIIAKLLVPETKLAKGQAPIDHVKKCWLKDQQRNPREIEDVKGQKGGPMPVFLAGPLKDAKKLDAKTIETKAGKFFCEGTSGRLEAKQGDSDLSADLIARLHEKAPFGLVQCEVKLAISRDGEVRENVTMQLNMEAIGKDAKSELPDAN